LPKYIEKGGEGGTRLIKLMDPTNAMKEIGQRGKP